MEVDGAASLPGQAELGSEHTIYVSNLYEKVGARGAAIPVASSSDRSLTRVCLPVVQIKQDGESTERLQLAGSSAETAMPAVSPC